MKKHRLEDIITDNYGPKNSAARIAFDQKLKIQLIREEIKKLRKQNKLTQQQLGERIGVQRAQISKLENNAENITLGTLIKVLSALNAQISLSITPN
ncbi:helix-turn-helix domain-containing protein [Chitinophagales bacterium]|nr:helix-turn-helix domain-containing protein [Chitinophagales bacterium]